MMTQTSQPLRRTIADSMRSGGVAYHWCGHLVANLVGYWILLSQEPQAIFNFNVSKYEDTMWTTSYQKINVVTVIVYLIV